MTGLISGSSIANTVTTGTFTDNTSKPDAAGVFLNGNTMTYDVSVNYSYNNTTQHYDAVANSAIPFGLPIPTDQSGNAIDLSMVIVPTDLSNNEFSTINVKINKNGRDLISLIMVAEGPDGTVVYDNAAPSAIVYNNVLVPGQIAAGQWTNYPITIHATDKFTKVLGLIINPAGTELADYPNGGFLA